MSDREKFSTEELSHCLHHYDLGKIKTIQEFARGSRRSPKVLIETARGRYLFKRRSKGKDDLARVAFTHRIQTQLASQGFPLPKIVRTRHDHTMVIRGSCVYEMFEFIEGGLYDASVDATYHSGKILGLYHKLLQDFPNDYNPPIGSYHNAQAIRASIRLTISSLPLVDRPAPELINNTVNFLDKAYEKCASEADAAGLADWPVQIVHGDWHPGNILYMDRHVVAVIDYDSARQQQRVIDLANGALQFSIIGGPEDPLNWPQQVDMERFKAFMHGYDSVNVIAKRELHVMPYLMCEAMIAEAVLPIAATGSFGRIGGFPFLEIIRKKVQWILDHIDQLHNVMAD